MDKIKLEQIKLNFKYKNLRELCEVTGVEYKDSTNSRESIRKELRRYMELKRVGRGYIITKIYDKPKEKVDGRGLNPNSHNNRIGTFKDYKNFKVDEKYFDSIGVYKITLSNYIYIGSTIVNFRARFQQHMNTKWNPLVTKDMLKDGAIFEIIEVMDNASETEIRKRESEYIKYYKEETNLEVVNSNDAWCYVEKKPKEKKIKEYFKVKNKYLAEALAFMGFRYYKFTDQDGKTVYSFKDTEKIKYVMNHLIQLKKELN